MEVKVKRLEDKVELPFYRVKNLKCNKSSLSLIGKVKDELFADIQVHQY